MKLAIVGSREFTDYNFVRDQILQYPDDTGKTMTDKRYRVRADFDTKEEADIYRQKIREIKRKLRMNEKNGDKYPATTDVFKIAIDLLYTSMKAHRNETKIVIDGELVYQARINGKM